jgi:hypothetical protein
MAVVAFNASEVELVIHSLPNVVDHRRLKLLPKILREWARTDLPQHYLSTEPTKTKRERLERLRTVSDCAGKLSRALDTALCNDDHFLIIREMIRADGRRLDLTERLTETDRLQDQFHDMQQFLERLSAASAASAKIWKQSRGHPTNIVGRLVLMDIVAIYEWLTGKKATRRVDRDTGKDTGPFWKFAVAIWPLVFGKGKEGLSATLRGWDDAVKQKLTGTRSRLIVNIAMRRPTWGVLDH